MTEKKSFQDKIEEEEHEEVFLDEKINIVQSGEAFVGHNEKKHVYSALLFSNLDRVVSCSRDCTIAIFDITSREILHSSRIHGDFIVRHLCRIDDTHVMSGCDDGVLVITSVEDFSQEVFLRLSDIKDDDMEDLGVYFILKINDELIAILTDDNIFVFVNLLAQKEQRVVKTFPVLSAHSMMVLSIVNPTCFYYNSSRIDDNAIRVFEVESMNVSNKRYVGHERMVYSMDVIRKTEDEELIVSAGFGDYISIYNSLSGIRKDIMFPLSVVRSLFVLPQMSTSAKYQYLLVGLRDTGKLYAMRLCSFDPTNEQDLKVHGYMASQVFNDGIRDIQLISTENNVLEVLVGSYDSTIKILHIDHFIEELEHEQDQRERRRFLFSRNDMFECLRIEQRRELSSVNMSLVPRLFFQIK